MTVQYKVMEIPENNWPGIFIAGDNAADLAHLLEIASRTAKDGIGFSLEKPMLKWAEILRSCWVPMSEHNHEIQR